MIVGDEPDLTALIFKQHFILFDNYPNDMKNKQYPGSIYRRSSSNRLIIEYRGKKFSTGLPDCEENRKIAEQMLWTLWKRDRLAPIETVVFVRKTATPDEAWDEYCQYLLAKGRAHKTITAYRDAYLKMRPKQLTNESIENAVRLFVSTWKGQPSSINTHLKNFNAFLHWCERSNYLQKAPDLTVFYRHLVDSVVQILSPDDISKVLSVLRAADDNDLADMVELIYNTGLRVGEAMTLSRAQITIVEGMHAIQLTKRPMNRLEYLPIPKKVSELLQQRPSGELYFPWRKSSASQLTRRFNAALRIAGVHDIAGFQILRRSFRHRLHIAGAPIQAVRRLMRYSDLRISSEYQTLFDSLDQI